MKMNRFSIIVIICIAVAMACTTCTKDTDFLPSEEAPSALKVAKADKYLPGTDITVKLKEDLEAGLSVTLPASHFYLSESIRVFGYPGGTIKGAGRDATIIEVSPGFEVPDHPLFPPGTGISSMLEIHAEGDVTCKAFTILVEGDHPAEGHIYSFSGAYSTNIDNVIVVIGDGISLECKDLRIKGEFVGDVEGAYNGYNVTWHIIGTGFGEPGLFNHLSVKNCVIDGAGGAGIDLWLGTTAELKDNVISNTDLGIWILENIGMQMVKDCHFSNITSMVFCIGDNNGPHCFKNNTLNG
jgi:hypothetical protein